MAPIELRFSFAPHIPVTIQPGREIKGRVSRKIDTKSGSRKIRLSVSCSQEDDSGSATVEILDVKSSLFGLKEERAVIKRKETTVQQGQVKSILLAVDEENPYWMFIKHKTGETNNSAL